MKDILFLESLYGASHVAPFPVTMVRANGIRVFDDENKSYIDMSSGISACNFGHNHPALVNALCQQAKKLAIIPRFFHNQPLSHLLEKACQLTGFEKALPMNSGAEAVETAIKIVRKWGYLKKGVEDNKSEIIVCDNSFHGRTVTVISMSSIAQYKANFGPLTTGFVSIPFDDIDALTQAITPNTIAFLVEPIQGEAGVIIPDQQYLTKARRLCKQHNVLLICDEIQCGLGRTGKVLTYQHTGIQPDLLLLGKSLGGGLLPISLVLSSTEVMQFIKPGDHGSTFGGNPLASAVAYEALNTLVREQLAENSALMGHYFLQKLQALQSPLLHSVRGKGLFIALEPNKQLITSKLFCRQLLKNGLISIDTRGYCVRLLPPLTINKIEIDEALGIIQKTLRELDATI